MAAPCTSNTSLRVGRSRKDGPSMRRCPPMPRCGSSPLEVFTGQSRPITNSRTSRLGAILTAAFIFRRQPIGSPMRKTRLPYTKTVTAKGRSYLYFDTGRTKPNGARIFVRLPDRSDVRFGGVYAAYLGQ